MEQAKGQRIKTAMNHGLVIGAIMVVLALIMSLFKPGTGSMLQLLHWAVIIGAVYYSLKIWRDNYNGGFIKYSQALGFGFRTMFFASVIYGFYTMVYMNWINPESIQENLAAIEEGYFQMGFNDEQIEEFMSMAQSLQTPGWQMFTTIIGTTFTGLIISLIVSIFIKKEGDPFQSAMSGIRDDSPEEEL